MEEQRGSVWWDESRGIVRHKIRVVDPQGKVIEKYGSVTPKGPTKRQRNDAIAKAWDKNKEILRKALDRPVERRMPTFAEWVDTCHANGAFKAQTTAEKNRGVAIAAFPIFGNKALDKITFHDIEAYFDTVKARGVRSSTLAWMKGSLSAYFGRASRKLGVKNPCSAVEVENDYDGAQPKRWLIPSEIQRLVATDRPVKPEARLLVLTALFMGLRREEAIGLRWQSVDLESGWLRIEHTVAEAAGRMVPSDVTKTKAGKRDLPIPHVVLELLKARRLEHPDSIYVLGSADKVPRPTTLYRDATGWFRALGLDTSEDPTQSELGKLTVRSLRHTYATYLMRTTLDPMHGTYMFGHAFGQSSAVGAGGPRKALLMEVVYAQIVWPIVAKAQEQIEGMMLGEIEFPKADASQAPVIRGS